MNTDQLAAALNEHMARTLAAPDAYEEQAETLDGFIADRAAGLVPRYGVEQAAYLERVSHELEAPDRIDTLDMASNGDNKVLPVA